jgi:hydrogenase expression/formation protein HypD
MHVCGTHEWTITHHGIRAILPETVEVRAGPGCPICITPAADIDAAVSLAREGVTVATYGDMARARGTEISLWDARSEGCDVRIVYSVSDAVAMARKEKEKRFIFFAVGFETTAPATAVEVLRGLPDNFSLLVSHRFVPPAVGILSEMPDIKVDAFLHAGHASTISGMRAYAPYFERSKKPMVFAGFEANDVLAAILMVLRQLKDGRAEMENEYSRSVTWEGNVKAQSYLNQVFVLRNGHWRGIGNIPSSGFWLAEKFSDHDARKLFDLRINYSLDLVPGCRCHEVIVGKIDPPECPMYMKQCTPVKPVGPCMVSIEGTCQIWAKHRIFSK